jgi:hypothetical protein
MAGPPSLSKEEEEDGMISLLETNTIDTHTYSN